MFDDIDMILELSDDQDSSTVSGKRPCHSGSSLQNSKRIFNNKVAVSEKTLKIAFKDEKQNFIDINWGSACEFINGVDNGWTVLAFGSDHKNVLISCDDVSVVEKLEEIHEITVDSIAYPVTVEKLTILSGRKGIIYNRILANLSDGQIKSELQQQGIVNFYRLEKADPITKQKKFTGSIIINCDSEIPSHLVIAKVRIFTNHLAPKPMLCFHCGLLGHTMSRCVKKAASFCQKCFHEHDSVALCIKSCKNCKGQHLSNDPSCGAIIREIQIVKIKESHGLNYIDAKAVSESVNVPVALDPLDRARLRIQQLMDRNSLLFMAGKQHKKENEELLIKLGLNEEKILFLEDGARKEREQFAKELSNCEESLETLQSNYQFQLDEGKKNMEQVKITSERLKALEKKALTYENAVKQLKVNKINDEKQIGEFLNSNESIGRAFSVFVNNKLTVKNYQAISLDLKLKQRSVSKERSQ